MVALRQIVKRVFEKNRETVPERLSYALPLSLTRGEESDSLFLMHAARPRILLAFDHSHAPGSLCLWREEEVCAQLPLQGLAEDLPEVLHSILLDQAVSYSSLTDLCVVRGPGSYTGLRAALAAAEALRLAVRGLRVYSLTGFEAMRLLHSRGVVLVLQESFRPLWYGQVFPKGRAQSLDDEGLRSLVLSLSAAGEVAVCGSASHRAFAGVLGGIEGLVLLEGDSTAYDFARPLLAGESSFYRSGADALSPLYRLESNAIERVREIC